MLAEHPGSIIMRGGESITNPMVIKLLWLLCLCGGIFGCYMMWTMNIPVPENGPGH